MAKVIFQKDQDRDFLDTSFIAARRDLKNFLQNPTQQTALVALKWVVRFILWKIKELEK